MTYEHNEQFTTLACHVERFTKERQFLKGVSPATLGWYESSFKAFAPVLERPLKSTAQIKAAVIERIVCLQTEGRGNKAVSINTYLRCLKAFLRWCHEEQIIKEPVKLSWLKEEEKIISTLKPDDIARLVRYTGNCLSERRVQHLAVLILDTGLRASEALSLKRSDVDFENLILRVELGKGRKTRLVPISQELRKRLWRYTSKLPGDSSMYVFATQRGTKFTLRNFGHDLKLLGNKLHITGVRFSPHTLRHTFAVNYLRAGGNVFYLQRILGHTSLEMTNRYCQSLGIDDLKAVHNGLSLLGR